MNANSFRYGGEGQGMRGHYRSSDDKKARLTITVPVEVEQQLRRLATQRGTGINPIVRAWIVQRLAAATNQATPQPDR